MKTLEEFCRSNLLHVILKYHNEGTSRNVEELTQMAYDEYTHSPQLRHLDSYFLNEIRFFPPKLSDPEQRLLDEHHLPECSVDMQKDNWCMKTERYLLSKLKRTDKRDDVLIVNSKMYRKNRDVVLFKYTRNKLEEARLERERQLKEKREFLAQLDVNSMSPSASGKGPEKAFRKSIITDFFAKNSKVLSPQKRKKKDRLFNTPDRDMYNSLNDSDGNNKSMASCTSQDSIVTVIEVKNQPKAVSNLPESAMYIKPGPASKKKLLSNRLAAELAAAQGKIINLSPIEIENTPPEELVTPSVKPKDPPKIIEVVTIPKEATLNVPQDGLPVEPSTSLPTFDLVDYQLKKRGLKVKPGPKRMKQKVLEKAKKLEDPDNFLNIRPCPGSKKRKYLQELFDSQPAFLKKFKDTVLAPEKPIAQPVLPPREVAALQKPRELTEPTDFAPVPVRPPPVFDLESIEAHKNAKRGTKLWLLLHGVYDKEKGIFVEPPEVDVACPEKPLSPMEGCSKWVAQIQPHVEEEVVLPARPPSTHRLVPHSQVDLIQEPANMRNLVLEKNARQVFHPKLFHFPELLRKVKEIVMRKAIAYEEQRKNPMMDVMDSTPPTSGLKEGDRKEEPMVETKSSEKGDEQAESSMEPNSPPLVKSRLEKRLEQISQSTVKTTVGDPPITPVSCLNRDKLIPTRRSTAGPLRSKGKGQKIIEAQNKSMEMEPPSTPKPSTPAALVNDAPFTPPQATSTQIAAAEPEMILCDQFGTQSQVAFSLRDPLATQDLFIVPFNMQVDSEVEVSTVPEEIIEINDDSCMLDEIMRDSPSPAKRISPVKRSPVKNSPRKVGPPVTGDLLSPVRLNIQKNPVPVSTPASLMAPPKMTPVKKTPEVNPQLSPKRTPTTRSKAGVTRTPQTKQNSAVKVEKPPTKITRDNTEVYWEPERRASPVPKVAYRYNALPLQRKGAELKKVGEPVKKKRPRRPRKAAATAADDIYTMVRFVEPSEGTAADVSIDDTTILNVDEADGEESSSGPSTGLNPSRDPLPFSDQLKNFMEEAERQNEGSSVSSFSYSKITRLAYERDAKGNFYSDCCPRCDLTVEFTLDGRRNLRFDMDVNRYLLHLTEDQWASFLNLLQRVDTFEYADRGKEAEESCCVIKRVLGCLLRTTPKLGVNTGAIKVGAGVGAKPVYLKRPTEGRAQPSSFLDLTPGINADILGKLEAEVSLRRGKKK